MAVNHVNLSNGEELIDLRQDTVTEDTLRAGVTAHNAKGEQIMGTGINADTVDGWNVDVISDGSDPENITKPTITFVYTAGG